jgi:hypothetical protein
MFSKIDGGEPINNRIRGAEEELTFPEKALFT